MTQSPTAKPLVNVKVLITRPRAQAADLASRVAALGGTSLLLPAIEILPSEHAHELADALARLVEFDWLVLTSVNGAAAVAEYVDKIPASVKIAAIGPATAQAIAVRFRAPDFVPSEYISDAIGPGMGDVAGKSILLARADIARKELASELTRNGARVTEIAAYSIKRAPAAKLDEEPTVITVTSSSAVRHTLENLAELGRENWRTDVPWVCIGPVTAETARQLGCQVAAIAKEYTVSGLVDALAGWASR